MLGEIIITYYDFVYFSCELFINLLQKTQKREKSLEFFFLIRLFLTNLWCRLNLDGLKQTSKNLFNRKPVF